MTAYPTVKMFIAGAWIETGEAGEMPVVNPATGAVIGQCPKASPAQLDAALKAADDAFVSWSRTPGAERHAILVRAAELLRYYGTRRGWYLPADGRGGYLYFRPGG